jgi:hypothetical protein
MGTSPSSSSGAGSSCTVSTSGPPNRLMAAARIRSGTSPAFFSLYMLLRVERLDGHAPPNRPMPEFFSPPNGLLEKSLIG